MASKMGLILIPMAMVHPEVNEMNMALTKATNEIISHNLWPISLQSILMVETISNGLLRLKILNPLHGQ